MSAKKSIRLTFWLAGNASRMLSVTKGTVIMESAEANPLGSHVLLIKNAILVWHAGIKWNGLTTPTVSLIRRLVRNVLMITTAKLIANVGILLPSMF